MRSDMDSFISYNSNNGKNEFIVVEEKYKAPDSENIFHESLWNLDFDGFVNRLRVGVGVWIHNMENSHFEGHAFRLKCTNNMVEYEGLILGLQIVRKLGAKRVSIMEDLELIIKKN